MITEIINGIYIGDVDSLLDKDIYQLYYIDIVINLTTQYQFLDNNTNKIRYPILNFMDYLDKYKKLIKFIYSKFINYINKN